MRNFKKRTIALVLASVVTVAGSFAADRYKNSLMGITFETAQNGATNMIVHTKTNYSGNLTPVKRDNNTYILTLPEMNSEAPEPDLLNNPYVEKVEVNTMPYTNSGNGYTKITIKTNNLSMLPVQHRVFLPDSKVGSEIRHLKEIELEKKQNEEEKRLQQEELLRQQNERLRQERLKQEQQLREEQQRQELAKQQEAEEEEETQVEETPPAPIDISSTNATPEENNEAFLLIMGVLAVILCSIYLFIKAKDRMAELSGESLDLDLKEDKKVASKKNEKEKSKKKINKIKNTIKTLDSTYSKTSMVPNKSEYTPSVSSTEESKPIEDVNVVDLDQLFQEQVQSQKTEEIDDENAALEDFLSGFSFDEEYGNAQEEVEEEQELYDEELYEQIINGDFEFNSDDINCINQLMQMEVADDTLRNIKEYLVSNPIKPVSKNKILEDLITTYAITQNINFTNEDVQALYKIINVEIDSDFITDLRTNPERTKEVSEEIAKAKNKVRKPSDIATLKVSDALPDLDEALKKQGNNKVKSDYKPQTVYFSEGYDVATLSIAEGLPDLSKEVNNKDAYVSKPSAKFDIVDNSYEFETLAITSELPNLSDVLQNPKNYEVKEEKTAEADEKALLANISNVEFKPFDDNSQNFEVLNDFDDFYAVDDSDPNDVLSFEEIAAEFEELYSIKITSNNNETEENNSSKVDNNVEQPVDVSLIEKELAHFFGSEQTVYDDMEESVVYTIPEKPLEMIEDSIEPKAEETFMVSDLNQQELMIEKSNPEALIVQEEKIKKESSNIKEQTTQEYVVSPLINLEQRQKQEIKRERSKLSESVLKKIQEKRAERNVNSQVKKEVAKTIVEKEETEVTQAKICVIENESYDVLSSVKFAYNSGCYLAKNSKGYFVIGYIGEKLFNIKTYETLKSEKIQARMSEQLDGGMMRYLVRIGINKFILDVDDKNIKFVMDLC